MSEAAMESDSLAPNYLALPDILQRAGLAPLAVALQHSLRTHLNVQRHKDILRWHASYLALPELLATHIDCQSATVTVRGEQLSNAQRQEFIATLQGLHPWRKGPFELFGVHIDTEWRSDYKWARLENEIEPLAGRRVLDVGCGSGYHCWRMAGAGAQLVIGIDPGPLFVYQFWAVQKYIADARVWVIPERLENMPPALRRFDTVFSMGVLYHRRSPLDHLQELRETLRPGGQLVLETLVVEDSYGDCLVPTGRYGKMGNVWFLPSTVLLQTWLKKMRFENIRLVDVSQTTLQEQRRTEWMRFESLGDFLKADDPGLTVEGHPAPRRAIVTATAS